MDIGTLSTRYAKALLQYATKKHQEDNVYKDMDSMLHAFLHIPSLRHTLNNPVIKDEDKIQLLLHSAGTEQSVCTKDFIALIVSKKRTDIISFMANSYLNQYRKYKNITIGRLTTAYEMDAENVKRLQEIVEQRCKGQVTFTVQKDESLKGGFILEYDTYRLDASLKEQLHRIRKGLSN